MSYNTPQGFLQGGTFFTTDATGAQVPARVVFGTTSVTGAGTVGVGFPVAVATATLISAAAGTVSEVITDLSLGANGSIIFRTIGTQNQAVGLGSFSFIAFGG